MNTKKYLTQKYYVIFIALLCSTLWGSAFPVLKVSYKELNIAASNLNARIILAGIRFLLAGLILFTILTIFMKKSIKVNRKQFRSLIVLGLFQTTLQYFFFYNGLGHTTGMKGAILSSTGNFFVVIIAHFIYANDKINYNKIFGLILGFLGIIVANLGKSSFNLNFTFSGEGFLIISSIMGALGTIFAKNIAKDIHPFVATGWQMFIGSIMLLSIGFINPNAATLHFNNKALILLVYSSFLSATAFSLWYSLLKYNKAGEITIYRFAIPVSGALLSTIFIPGEKFTINLILSLFLVALGIMSINYKKQKSMQ